MDNESLWKNIITRDTPVFKAFENEIIFRIGNYQKIALDSIPEKIDKAVEYKGRATGLEELLESVRRVYESRKSQEGDK